MEKSLIQLKFPLGSRIAANNAKVIVVLPIPLRLPAIITATD